MGLNYGGYFYSDIGLKRMKTKQPTISICIPTYNRAHYLKETINSVLAQTYIKFELIICNDGSSDETEKVIKLYTDKRIRYIKNSVNLGYIKTMNKCTKFSKNEWIMHLSDDDILLPEAIETMVKILNESKVQDIGFIVPQTITINSQGRVIAVPLKQLKGHYLFLKPKEFIPNFTLYGKKIRGKYIFNTSFPSTLFNKKILIENGMSSEKVPVSHDIFIESKICLKHSIIVIDDPLIKYRVHENWGSGLNQRGEFLKEYLQYLSLLFAFIKKEHIIFDYNFEQYCYEALINYLFSINGGIIRLAARYNGSYKERIKKINEYISFGIRYNSRLLWQPKFYMVSALAYLPQSILLSSGKLLKKI
jgi:glycosyltransferase involved in cell wall biosynthesis